MNRFFNIENKVTEFVDKIFENNDFLAKFGVVPEDLKIVKSDNEKDCFWNETYNKYEKYEGDKLVKRYETLYKNGEKVKDEKYEAPSVSNKTNTKDNKLSSCCSDSIENGCNCNCGGNCKCKETQERYSGVEETVNDDVIRSYEEIVRRGTQQLCDENTSLKEENTKLKEENTKLLLNISEFKEEVVKYQTELENINGFITLYQETLKEQNDKIQELVEKLEKYQDIENIINQIRK